MSRSAKQSRKSSQTPRSKRLGLLISAALIVVVGAGMVINAIVSGSATLSTSASIVVDGAARPQVVSQRIDPAGYMERLAPTDHVLLDVRTPAEFAGGHIPGAINISVETLASRLDELPTDLPIVVYCRSGNRSVTAAQILTNAGAAPAIYDLGGILAWQSQGLPVE